jgi:hypothetical protein
MEPGDKGWRDVTVWNVVRSCIHQAPKGLLKWGFVDLADPVVTVEFAARESGDHLEH